MKNSLVKSIEILLFIIFIQSQVSFTQSRDDGEIIPAVVNLPEQYVESKWTCTYKALSSIRWGENNMITTRYYSEYVTGYGNNQAWYGFDAPDGYGSGNCPDIGHGLYELKWSLPTGYKRILTIDLRDADYCGTRPPYPASIDLYIRWDEEDTQFEYKNESTGGVWEYLAGPSGSVKLWELYEIDDGEENKEVFQPTPPKNLRCTNPNEQGAHPQFQWDPPDWPGMQREQRNLTTYYYISRNTEFCAKDLTQLTWSDQNVIIDSNGSTLTYYAEANVCHESPFSEPSKSVIIKGNISKLQSGKNISSNMAINKTTPEHLLAQPNPFNPTTKISYYLLEASPVKIMVYNMAGQKTADLVNEFKYQGEHSVDFDGQSLAGGIYFVRMPIKNQQIIRKILLLK